MGKRPDPVEYSTATADGPRSLAATRNVSLQARAADTEVPSASEGENCHTAALYSVLLCYSVLLSSQLFSLHCFDAVGWVTGK